MTDHNLDPEDWDIFEKITMDVVGHVIRQQKEKSAGKPWQRADQSLQVLLAEDMPQRGTDPAQIFDFITNKIMPYSAGNDQGRHWGWVNGTPSVYSALSEYVAANMNINCWNLNQGGNFVEQQLMKWLKEVMLFGPDSGGLMVSGGSHANLTALIVARDWKIGPDARTRGVAAAPAPLRFYASSDVHYSVPKAMSAMGLGTDALHCVPTDHLGAIDIGALEKAIQDDLAAGYLPAALVANMGTTNKGAIDDLEALKNIADYYDLWLHVDGAFGAMIRFSDKYGDRATGLVHADSLGFDLHKWGSQCYAAGCVMVRDGALQQQSFTAAASYLDGAPDPIATDSVNYAAQGLELSRPFRALKVWSMFKIYGRRGIGRVIDMNIDQAHYMSKLVEESDRLELLSPTVLNIVNYRYKDDRLSDRQLNELNRQILSTIWNRQIGQPSYTNVDGRFSIRLANVNHRSKIEDFEILAQATQDIGDELTQ